jgi:hypothetical protein
MSAMWEMLRRWGLSMMPKPQVTRFARTVVDCGRGRAHGFS